MGNYMSCTVITPIMKSSKAARVILPGGEVKQFRELIKAAELMLESPNYFLVNSKSLNIGKRFSAISADEDLEIGNLYILFPMRRVHSVATAADMAVVLMAVNSAAKRIAGGGNVTVSPTPVAAMGNVDMQRFGDLEVKYRSATCRSRKPLLDTILEEPVSAR